MGNKKYEVDDEICSKATSCGKGLSCLSGERDDLCRIKYCVEGTVHFIECVDDKFCPYKKRFGEAFHCSCPVRKALYAKYKI